MKNKKTFIFLIILFLSLLTLYIVEKSKFPVKLYNCEKGFKDCFVWAKFDDMDSCQKANQKSGWYCDESDKNHIVCVEKESSIVDTYCSK